MTRELTINDRYVFVSRIDRYSSIYDLELNKEVVINGSPNIAKNIKLDDNISFSLYSLFEKKNIQINLKVRSLEYSRYPASCFTGDCLIQTTLGLVSANALNVEDTIVDLLGNSFPIKCILETKINNQIDMMVHPDGLVITGYHPVRIGDKWCFPYDTELFEKQSVYVDSIYSIGLEGGISLVVNGIEVAGLGHGVHNDAVLSHPYFGSDLVIRDIFKLAPNGHCVIEHKQIVRSDITGLVCGIMEK